ncbi:unnamed protein product [Calypogeia fissa]
MPGTGKGGKGGAKRHKEGAPRQHAEHNKAYNPPPFGVKRLSGLTFEETRCVLKAYIVNTIRNAVIYMEHSKRKTVTAMDVVYSLQRQDSIRMLAASIIGNFKVTA